MAKKSPAKSTKKFNSLFKKYTHNKKYILVSILVVLVLYLGGSYAMAYYSAEPSINRITVGEAGSIQAKPTSSKAPSLGRTERPSGLKQKLTTDQCKIECRKAINVKTYGFSTSTIAHQMSCVNECNTKDLWIDENNLYVIKNK